MFIWDSLIGQRPSRVAQVNEAPDLESAFNELLSLALNPDPLEERFFIELDKIERITGMINSLPEIERRKWIHYILGSLVGAIEGGKTFPRSLMPSRN